jgi:hypothetical protein
MDPMSNIKISESTFRDPASPAIYKNLSDELKQASFSPITRNPKRKKPKIDTRDYSYHAGPSSTKTKPIDYSKSKTPDYRGNLGIIRQPKKSSTHKRDQVYWVDGRKGLNKSVNPKKTTVDKIKGKREGLRSRGLNTNKKVNRDLNFSKEKTGTGPVEGEPAVYRPTHHSLYGRPEGFKDRLDRAASQSKTKKKTPNKLIPRKSEGAENFNPCSIKLSGTNYTIDEYVHDPKQLRKKSKINFDFGNLK